jgi:transposase
MIIIGVDFHPEFQQTASVDTDTGEFQERRLAHREEAEQFYRTLVATGQQVRVGMEASGHGRWFERLLGELQVELWVGDAAEIRTKRVRKQKTDRQDAQLILKLMLKDDFPRIWVPSWENRDPTTMASPPYGAGPHPDDESVASSSVERRSAV